MDNKAYSYLLVALQFGAIGLMLYSDHMLLFHNPLVAVMLLAGLGIGLSAVLTNRKFNIIPEINEEACLVTHGIYRYVRHPMYFSLLVAFFGFFIFGSLVSKAAYVLLIVVLFLKAKKEERLWHCKDEEYARYKRRTKMFIPFVL